MPAMALTTAQRQARWKAKRDTLARNNPDVIQHELEKEIERVKRGELSEQERIALAEQLADLAVQYQWRASTLAKLAMKVRTNDREISVAWWQNEIVPKITEAPRKKSNKFKS
jgi:hypothetical protein